MCTCARARTHAYTHLETDRQTLAQMPHRRSPSPTRPLSLCCCQIKAWRAGHKGECVMAAARADMRTAAKPTADQMCVLKILEQLAGAADWRGVAAQERAARAVAAAVRTSMPSKAAWVYCILGIAYKSLGSFSKAITYHAQHLAIAKEVGDRAGEGRAYANLGCAYGSQGDFSQAITYHVQHLVIAKEVGDRAGQGAAYGNLGCAYQSQGDFSQAITYHAQDLAIAKEVGDRAGEGRAYANLGCAYQSQGDFSKAITYHAQDLAIAKEVGDRAGEGRAYGNLGCAYQSQGDFSQAITYHEQDLAIAKEVGDRAGQGAAYGNLGYAYQSQGDFSQAITYHEQHLAIAKEVGDRAGGGKAFGYLGCAYQSQGDFSQAITYHAQHLAIAKEVGDRAGEGPANANLGTCHMHLIEYDKAVAYFKAQHALGMSLKLAHVQAFAALNMGVALTLHVRAARQGTATGADQAPGPHSHSLASTCLKDRVRESAKWLQAAFDGGRPSAKLHLAHLTFEAGQEDAALAHLKEHLSWLVQRGRDICAGCGQTRGEDTLMLTCSGCHVARFCSADHQKMASKKAALGGSLTTGRHKDICRVLNKWREVVKDVVLPDSCTTDLVAFLQR
jgi:tetratricopeptide (TPR) repeat protein